MGTNTVNKMVLGQQTQGEVALSTAGCLWDEYRAVSVGLRVVTICWSSHSYRRAEMFTVGAAPPCFLGRGEPTATACDKDGDVDEDAAC